MLEVDITGPMRKRAKYYAEKLGTLQNSFTRGDGNIAGYLGELSYIEEFGGTWAKNDRDYDIVTINGLFADVKTKRCSGQPKPEYECSVSSYNTDQDCDIYIFTRVQKDYKKCWILGWITKEKYYDQAVFRKKGEIDSANGWIVSADCYNLPIFELNDFTEEFFFG